MSYGSKLLQWLLSRDVAGQIDLYPVPSADNEFVRVLVRYSALLSCVFTLKSDLATSSIANKISCIFKEHIVLDGKHEIQLNIHPVLEY